MPHTCLVCHYPKLKEPPRSPSGGGSYEICPSCGYQYGVDDDDRQISHAQWLKKWQTAGCRWSSQSIKQPKDWKPSAPAPVKKSPAKKSTAKKAPAKKPPPKKSK